MVLSHGLLISLGFTLVIGVLLFFYLRHSISSVENKVNVLFQLVQDEAKLNAAQRAGGTNNTSGGGMHILETTQGVQPTVTVPIPASTTALHQANVDGMDRGEGEEEDEDKRIVVSDDESSIGDDEEDDLDSDSDSDDEDCDDDEDNVDEVVDEVDGENNTFKHELHVEDLEETPLTVELSSDELHGAKIVDLHSSGVEVSDAHIVNKSADVNDIPFTVSNDLDNTIPDELDDIELDEGDDSDDEDDMNTTTEKDPESSDTSTVTQIKEEPPVVINYKKLSVSQLREIVKDKNLAEDPKKLKKTELVKLLEQ
jgi:hypothetical protein